MYYVDNDSILVDTIANDKMLKEKMIPQFSKKTDTDNFKISLPLIMLFDTRQTIGSPDVIDQGGLILEFKLLGITKRFNIDPFSKIKYYPNLIEDVNEKIEAINMDIKNH